MKPATYDVIHSVAKPALLATVAGIGYSEVAHILEQRANPVIKSDSILPFEVYECKDPSRGASAPTLVFLEGWPDDITLFRPFARALSAKYRCINCNLPGYPLPKDFAGNKGCLPAREWGFTLQEAVLALENTIRLTCSNSLNVTLVTHDWGAVIGYLLHQQRPGNSLIQRMVSLDVGWRVDGFPFLGFAGILFYQAFLNIFFMLPEALGSPLTALEQFLLGRVASPGASPVSSRMNWPYRSAWRDMLTRGFMTNIDSYIPSGIPMLFIHGDSLPNFIRFYDEKWQKNLEKTCPGTSKFVCIRGNHWFMNTRTEETLDVIRQWLDESEPHTRAKL